MPCQDCERAISELRAELDVLRDMSARRQDALLDTMNKVIDKFAAKNEALLTKIDLHVQDVFARLQAAIRSAEKDEPPVCH